MRALADPIERTYDRFAEYPAPAQLWVCPQCGPEWSAEDIRTTSLRSLSLAQLVAIHLMSLDDDSLRHFFPRLMELLLQTASPVFDFRLTDLKDRSPGWPAVESAVVRQLDDAVWSALLTGYPADLGYFSDCPSALDLLDWCELPLTAFLEDLLVVETVPAGRHLAYLVDAVLTTGRPF